MKFGQNVFRTNQCPHCEGTGRAPGDGRTACGFCDPFPSLSFLEQRKTWEEINTYSDRELQTLENYYAVNKHELNLVADWYWMIQEVKAYRRALAEADAVREDEEPPMCACGKHYVGAPCNV